MGGRARGSVGASLAKLSAVIVEQARRVETGDRRRGHLAAPFIDTGILALFPLTAA